MDKIKDFFGALSSRDLPPGVAALVGVLLLILMFKTAKMFMKLVLFILAVGLFVGAYWWRQHGG